MTDEPRIKQWIPATPENITHEELEAIGWLDEKRSDAGAGRAVSISEFGKKGIGSFQYLTIMAIIALKDQAFGADIRRWLQDNTDQKDINFGQVYSTFHRLIKVGVLAEEPNIKIRQSHQVATRYAITERGMEVFGAATKYLEKLRDLRNKLDT